MWWVIAKGRGNGMKIKSKSNWPIQCLKWGILMNKKESGLKNYGMLWGDGIDLEGLWTR